MKAIVHTKYRPPDELQLIEVENPVPGDNEVLVKIHATTVTTTDCNARNFTFVPKSFMFFARIVFGFKKPRIKRLGIDLAGEIEAIGKNVKLFKEGDHIFWDDLQMNKNWSFENGIYQAMIAKRIFLVKLHNIYREMNDSKVTFIGIEISKTVWSNQINIIPVTMKTIPITH